ncbi:hypothetical protein JCM10212_005526 [Sporobolomyces blumeae]
MACKVWPIWASSRESSGLVWLILRDDLMFYGLNIAIDVTTTVLLYGKDDSLGPITAPLSIVLASVLATHLVLNLRQFGRSTATSEKPVEDEDGFTIERALAYQHRAAKGPEDGRPEREDHHRRLAGQGGGGPRVDGTGTGSGIRGRASHAGGLSRRGCQVMSRLEQEPPLRLSDLAER